MGRKKLLVLLTFMLCGLLPINVFAYTLTFTAEEGHTMVLDIDDEDDQHFYIDGKIVRLVNDAGDEIGGDYNCSNTQRCTITCGTEGKLEYTSNNAFVIYNITDGGHTEYAAGTKYNTNQSLNVEDYVVTPPATVNIDVSFTFTNTTASVMLNGAQAGSTGASWSGTVSNVPSGTTDSSETNEITITTPSNALELTGVTINDTFYTFSTTGASHTVEVPGAASYTITGTAIVPTPKTLIWTNSDWVAADETEATTYADYKIGHGFARVVAVYDKTNTQVAAANYIDLDVYSQFGLNNGFGRIDVLPGYKVMMEFIPEAGYQFTSITLNGAALTATGNNNRFEFTMPDVTGTLHFVATTTATNNVATVTATGISNGTVSMATPFENGTALLTISDANISEQKRQAFQAAAEGYTLSNFVSIDLYNVFYKGDDGSTSVWSVQVHEVDDYVTISFVLAEGIDANDIKVVHNINNGDNFEVIDIESYDAETRTITFKAKKFSDFAIAYRTVTTPDPSTDNNNGTPTETPTNNETPSNTPETTTTTEQAEEVKGESTTTPQTGDNIFAYVLLLGFSVIGFGTLIKVLKEEL